MNENIPLHQKLAFKIRELRILEMTNIQIAKTLNISQKTVNNALKKSDNSF